MLLVRSRVVEHHLAEFNIARLRYDPDDPRVAPFMKALDAVNAAAESTDLSTVADMVPPPTG